MTELPYRSLSARKAVPSYWHRPGEQICLHLGESPFPPTDAVQRAICDAAGAANYYPDTNAVALRDDLAGYVGHNVCPEQIIVGNGSDDLIQLTVQTFLPKGGTVVSFEPTFFYYGFCTAREGERYAPMFRRRADKYDLPPMEEIHSHIQREKPDLVFLANPNNPTGGLVDRDRVLQLLQRTPGTLVVDECYFEFAGQSVVDLIQEHSNLIVLRSLSKSFSLAGVRIGYAVACRERIDALERMALTFPVNAIAQTAARAALRETEIMRERIGKIITWRENLARELNQLGLDVFPSHTNFLLVCSGLLNKIPDDCALCLSKRGILVSNQTHTPGIEGTALRITVGTPDQLERLLQEIREFVTGY
ncbi:MAG TPA: histidinol-phosphate transaminase [bacterium]|nr:histidinol-phosphate transaminase [bacterium]HPO08012.1 histidinol-phosphate transaminase [bacterium]HQO33668.1 histidinol-phosphate transaminase [bacterium]HQP98673.1 histidinol-phosphate transaminase [bacterium]